jgi:hypothetical protein
MGAHGDQAVPGIFFRQTDRQVFAFFGREARRTSDSEKNGNNDCVSSSVHGDRQWRRQFCQRSPKATAARISTSAAFELRL